jgi:chromosome partitioning protein
VPANGELMVVITVASRNSGSGKSTLTAHLAAYANRGSRRCLLIDADPRGTLTRWHSVHKNRNPLLRNAADGIDKLVKAANDAGIEWVFIDTPAQISAVTNEAIRAATLVVVPARPSSLNLGAEKETIAYCREQHRRYAVVLNDAPPRRDNADAPVTTTIRQRLAKLKVPVWSGQITRNTSLSLAESSSLSEYNRESRVASEFARLLSAIEHFVRAIQGDRTPAVNIADLMESILLSQAAGW